MKNKIKNTPKFSSLNIFKGLTLKFFSVLIAITIVSVGILAILPFSIVKEFISENQKKEMELKVLRFSNMINSYYFDLDTDIASDIINVMEINDIGRIIVTDCSAKIIYDNVADYSEYGKVVLASEVLDALEGRETFDSKYTSDYFEYVMASPIKLNDEIIGTIYIRILDKDKAVDLNNIKTTIFIVCISLFIFSVLLIFVLLTYMRKQINEINKTIIYVKNGKYNKQAKIVTKDELGYLANEFNELSTKLWDIEEKRKRFVSDASHELKTPLATIKVLSEGILSCQDDNLDMRIVREFMGDINSEIDRLTRVSNRLIQLTKMDEKGSLSEENISPIFVKPIIDRVFKMTYNFAENRGIKLVSNVGDNVCVIGTEDGLYEIIFNLVENAIKYSKEKGKLNIRSTEKDNKIILSFKDDGIGIPKSDIEKIFNRFYRVDKARSRETGGSGLGLSVVYEIVNMFKGTINVYSVLGEGTEFIVELLKG